jgi:hypothetical protein
MRVLICLLCSVINLSFVSDKFLSKQSILTTPAPCFGLFENLYFDPLNKVFFTNSKRIDLSRAVHVNEQRGYFWKNVRDVSLPRGRFHRIPGLTLILQERASTPFHYTHFFHFLEHLIGFWSFGGKEERENVHLVLIAGNGDIEPKDWRGPNEITFHLIRALFPNADIQLFSTFISTNKPIWFERALSSDRSMEFHRRSPYFTDRMLSEYHRFLPQEALDSLTAAVHTYCEAQPQNNPQLNVTYVRRLPPRCLDADVEKELLFKIEQLPGVRLQSVDFAQLSFQEQIKIAAQTDVLLGVHGNGLSHTLFLPKGATLIELFSKDFLRVEYRIFAGLRNLSYFGMMAERGWIDQETVERTGIFGIQQKPIDDIDVDAIVSVISSCKKANS